MLEGEGVGGRGAERGLRVLLLEADHESVEATEVGVDDVVDAVANGAVIHLLRVADQSIPECLKSGRQLDSLVTGSDLQEAQYGVTDGGGEVEVGGFHEETLFRAICDHDLQDSLKAEVRRVDSLKSHNQVADEKRLSDLRIIGRDAIQQWGRCSHPRNITLPPPSPVAGSFASACSSWVSIPYHSFLTAQYRETRASRALTRRKGEECL